GDPERRMDQLRRKEGIPLLDTVVKDLQSLSEQYQVKF
ncbi:MAG: Ldh family oxidoreductase, partial [Flammeovirgaceae bacterium]|nr:Ldh family oxidoreductase [Flammeovirgaceae bacterium]